VIAAASELRALAGEWTLLRSAPADGATNMAADLALLREAQSTGRATLRLYSWSAPTLSLGRHERALGRFSPERLTSEGISIVRRPTGGRALLHGPELTYSVAAPSGTAPLRWRYDCINALLLDALQSLGVQARPYSAERHSRPGSSVCFSEPSSGELTVDGAKLVASAQLEEPGAFLQHGSLLLRDAQPSIARLMIESPSAASTDAQNSTPALASIATHATALEDLVPQRASFDAVADAVAQALEAAVGAAHVTSGHTLESLLADVSLAPLVEHFRDPNWTWSR